jgi:hypothetical protein
VQVAPIYTIKAPWSEEAAKPKDGFRLRIKEQ